MRLISGSIGRKLAALLIAIVGFVFLHETRMLDSRNLTLESFVGARTPSPGSRLAFNATAYCKGTTTASGVGVRTGIAAADPSLLPVGSVINIAAGDARYSGVYTVMDTGPKVQGRLLDLYMWSCHEALKFGRREVGVTVLRLGWDPKASSPTLIDRLFKGREARRQVPPADAPPPAGLPPEDATDQEGDVAAAADVESSAPGVVTSETQGTLPEPAAASAGPVAQP